MQKTKPIHLTAEQATKFWSKVDRNGPGGCWLWTGVPDRVGYGSFHSSSGNYLAHRVAYVLATGDQADGLEVLHECPNELDDKRCVNPSHLRAGTHKENMARCSAIGRIARGERCSRAELAEEQVLAIIAAEGKTEQCLADEHGVSVVAIHKIRSGESWRHVPRTAAGKRRRRTKLNESQVRDILRSATVPATTLARKHGCSRQNVCDIRAGRSWQHLYEEFHAKHRVPQPELNLDVARGSG